MSPVELQRIFAEWRVRLHRVKEILQPPTWSEKEWRQFSQALALMVRDHGRSWIIEPNVYWDLRWHLQEGGELICQIEHIPGEKTSLVVAQNGGFAEAVGSYTWLWAEFNMEGHFSRDPYWVEGTWKDALTSFLLPLDRQSSYLLAGRAQTPDSLLLQEGARPNDRHLALMPGLQKEEDSAFVEFHEEKNGVVETMPATTTGDLAAEKNVETPATPIPAVEKVVELGPETKSAQPENGNLAKSTEPLPTVSLEPSAGTTTPTTSPRVDTPEPFAIRWGMAYQLTWKDSDDIGYALADKFPDQNPLKLSFPKLHKLVIELEDFKDEPDKSSEGILEAIQMAWYEEVK